MNTRIIFVLLTLLLSTLLTSCSDKHNANQKQETLTMKKKVINPWTWQDRFGFVQANEVSGAQRMLFCAGQISVDENGELLHPNDMKKQLNQILDNMEVLLEQANFQLSDVVRFTYYTTDISAFTEANLAVLANRLKENNCKPATSLIGVAALARPGCVVEIEATLMD